MRKIKEDDGRGVGCSGIGIPDVFCPTVSRRESTFCPEAREEGALVDDHRVTLSSFGPPTEDEFSVAGQKTEEDA